MAQKNKELLLIDLSARLPYGVKIEGYSLSCITLNSDWLHFMYTHQEFAIRRPYLRPLSSMTRAEVLEYISLKESIVASDGITYFFETYKSIDWLNKKMFAYRIIDGKDMFELGLALEAPEGMYNIKDK